MIKIVQPLANVQMIGGKRVLMCCNGKDFRKITLVQAPWQSSPPPPMCWKAEQIIAPNTYVNFPPPCIQT